MPNMQSEPEQLSFWTAMNAGIVCTNSSQRSSEPNEKSSSGAWEIWKEHGTRWDRRFLKLALEVSSWSKDPSTQVGSVIVKGNRVVSLGYNGFPRELCDDKHLYSNRETKLQRIVHAEVNAILNAGRSVEGCMMYVTHPPCSKCALIIIQSGIDRVVSVTPPASMVDKWADEFELARALFDEAGIEYGEIEAEETV